jgi:ABC-type glycerol-3-phosphate transport system substrate-binding protein
MKKFALILSVIMSVLLAANCSKKSLPSSPDSSTTTPDIQETLTYSTLANLLHEGKT